MRHHEYPFIGYRKMIAEPVDSEAQQYETLWAKYEPKIRSMVHQCQITGAVGADEEDMMAHARSVLLQAIRSYDPVKGQFSTHYYTLLHHHFNDVRRKYPRSKWLVQATHETKGLYQEIIEGYGNLEASLVSLRSDGYRILQVVDRTPNTPLSSL